MMQLLLPFTSNARKWDVFLWDHLQATRCSWSPKVHYTPWSGMASHLSSTFNLGVDARNHGGILWCESLHFWNPNIRSILQQGDPQIHTNPWTVWISHAKMNRGHVALTKNPILESCPHCSIAETLDLLIGRTSVDPTNLQWSSQIARHHQASWKRSHFNNFLRNNNCQVQYYYDKLTYHPGRNLVIWSPEIWSSGHPTWRLQWRLELPVVQRRNPGAPHSFEIPARWRPRNKPTPREIWGGWRGNCQGFRALKKYPLNNERLKKHRVGIVYVLLKS